MESLHLFENPVWIGLLPCTFPESESQCEPRTVALRIAVVGAQGNQRSHGGSKKFIQLLWDTLRVAWYQRRGSRMKGEMRERLRASDWGGWHPRDWISITGIILKGLQSGCWIHAEKKRPSVWGLNGVCFLAGQKCLCVCVSVSTWFIRSETI